MFNTKNNLVVIIYILNNFIILATFLNKNEILFIMVAEGNTISLFFKKISLYLFYIMNK
jgi:hypothetical protein